MLQDKPLDYIREQFTEKDNVLAAYGERVSAATLYEDMFGVEHMQDIFPVVIIGEDEAKHIVPMPLDEAIEQAAGRRNDMLIGACSYFNNWVSKRSCRDVYGFIIDADNFYSGTLQNALQDNWYTASGDYTPMPTYIVNSGTGLHLYYLFDSPIPNYKSSTRQLDMIYRALAVQQTTRRVFLHKQVQWFGQDFRMAGGLNKYGWINSAYKVGSKWDIDKLAQAVGFKDIHVRRYDEQRQPDQQPQRRRIVRKGWRTSPRFYEYALKNCHDKTKEGNRYTSMCALVTIAWKCGVSIEQVERDLLALLPKYNDGATNPIKANEIQSALKMYNDRAILTQRATLETWQGWEYKPQTQRHTGKQKFTRAVSLAVRSWPVRDAMYPGGEWRHIPGTKQQAIEEWQRQHPGGKKSACHADTGISRTTIDKWWRG